MQKGNVMSINVCGLLAFNSSQMQFEPKRHGELQLAQQLQLSQKQAVTKLTTPNTDNTSVEFQLRQLNSLQFDVIKKHVSKIANLERELQAKQQECLEMKRNSKNHEERYNKLEREYNGATDLLLQIDLKCDFLSEIVNRLNLPQQDKDIVLARVTGIQQHSKDGMKAFEDLVRNRKR
jgi:hypothetical protein